MALASQSLPLARRRTSPLLVLLEWWHLLSLDAPSVTILWAWSFARVLDISLAADSLLLLFTGTWLLYVADRVLDGLHSDPSRLRERHFFYKEHRITAIAVAIPVAVLLAWLVFVRMLPGARHADLLIIAIAAAYFALVHLCGQTVERWFPKELIVALVFSAATAVPAWVRLNRHHHALALLAALFAGLCWLNCIAIDKWEQGSGASVPNRLARWGQRHLLGVSAALGGSALLMAAYLLCIGQFSAAALCLAMVLSVDLFVALDTSSRSTIDLRIAADAALLTPLLLLLFIR